MPLTIEQQQQIHAQLIRLPINLTGAKDRVDAAAAGITLAVESFSRIVTLDQKEEEAIPDADAN